MIGYMPPAMIREDFFNESREFDKYILSPSLKREIAIPKKDLEDFTWDLEIDLSNRSVAKVLAEAYYQDINQKEILDSLIRTKKIATINKESIRDLPEFLQEQILKLKGYALNFIDNFLAHLRDLKGVSPNVLQI
jgi:hypothetical protein